MLIRFAEIYENTEILSPVDRRSWEFIGKTCRLSPASRVMELASGKGAFAFYLAKNFGCRVDCFDINSEFVDYCAVRATDLGLASRLRFTCCSVDDLEIEREVYDLGVCLGSLYLFREAGWRVLMKGVGKQGYLAISDLFCRKVPPPPEVMQVFFEEEGPLPTLEYVRHWYTDRGLRVLQERECTREAWREYYDSMDRMLSTLAVRCRSDQERQAEIKEAFREVSVARKYGEYLGYMMFIMRKT